MQELPIVFLLNPVPVVGIMWFKKIINVNWDTAWLNLAWSEFWLPYRYFKKGGCPGGRDFIWITVFIMLVMIYGFLLIGTREGLLNRFVDVLLGNVPGHGVAVWVRGNAFSKGGVNLINTSVLKAIRNKGYEVYPYRGLETSLHPPVSLPGSDIWHNKDSDGKKYGPDFNGMAVYENDPLWPASKTADDLPLEIVVSRSLFKKYFNYDNYRKQIIAQMPQCISQNIPQNITYIRKKPLDKIYLRIQNGFHEEIIPFRIHWVEQINTVQKIAYLFPLKTLHALKAAHRFPKLRYFPETHGAGGYRIKKILIEQEDYLLDTRQIAAFIKSLKGKKENSRGDVLIILDNLLPLKMVQAQADYFKTKFQIIESIKGDFLKHSENNLHIPCQRLPNNLIPENDAAACIENPKHLVSLDVTDGGNGFSYAFVYVPNRSRLTSAIKTLLQINDNALLFHELYQDGLNRFGFLSQIIEKLQYPYSFFLLLFLFALLSVQVIIHTSHRSHQYGIFIAKGILWWQIYLMLWFQLLLSVIMGLLGSICLIWLARYYLIHEIKQIVIEYKNMIHIGDLDLLPIATMEYLTVFTFVYIVACLISAIILYFIPIQRHVAPSVLLKSRF